MSAGQPIQFRVRDGTDEDIAAVLALDSRYETNHVLQVYLHGRGSTSWEVNLQRERLPRPVELSNSFQRAQLRSALDHKHCLLLAEQVPADDKAGAIIGALVMTPNNLNGFALIQNITVSARARRHKAGTRLLMAAGIWAKERGLNRLMAEVQTKNTPAISFLESLGFSFCGFNDHYFPDENVALFFSLPLK